MAVGTGFYILFIMIMIATGIGTIFGLKSISHFQTMSKIGNWSLFLLLFLIIFLGFLGGAIIYSWLTMSALYTIKKREQKLSIGQALREGWSRWLSYLWISSLVSLCVAGGTILLIIPGIIFFVWFAFSPYLLVDQDIKGTNALSESRELVRGYWWPVFGRLILITLIAIGLSAALGFIPFVGKLIVQLLVIPFILVFYFILYEDLKRLRESHLTKV